MIVCSGTAGMLHEPGRRQYRFGGRQPVFPAPVRLALVALAAVFAAAPPAIAAKVSELRQVEIHDQGVGFVLDLTLSGSPHYKVVQSGRPNLFVVDLPGAIFRAVRQRLKPSSDLAEYVVVSQYDRRTVRLVVKRDPSARVDVARDGTKLRVRVRHPASGFRPGDEVVAAASSPDPAAARAIVPIAFPSREPSKRPRIVIDPGHGGRDPGAVGPHTTDKAVALDVAKQLEKILAGDPRLEVHFTRLEDRFVSLEDRGALAQRVGADLFLSLHANSGPRSAYGYEVWYLSTRGSQREARRLLSHGPAEETAPATDLIQRIIVDKQREGTLNKSSLLAGHLNRALEKTGQRSRGVGEENFAVLRSVAVPSVLLELGFLTNPGEEKKLMTRSFQEKQARAIYHGVVSYLESQGRLGPDKAPKTMYAVRRNDTLSTISQRFGVEVLELTDTNGLDSRGRIYVGQLLEIPGDPVGSLLGDHIE